MPRRTTADNLRDILTLINQSRKTEATIEQQRAVIEFLRMQPHKTATRKEITDQLGIKMTGKGGREFESSNAKKMFYKVMTPMLRTILLNDREELEYTLSEIKFTTWFDSLKKTGKEIFG